MQFKLHTIIAILLFFNCLILSSQEKQNRDEIHKTGLETHKIVLHDIQTGKYQSSLKRLTDHLENNPNDFEARLLLIQLSEITGDKRELFNQRRFLKNCYSTGKANTAPALTAVAKSLWDIDPNGALMLLKEAQKKDKNYIEAYIQAGNLCYDKYAWGKAKKEFAKVLKIAPANPEALTGLAMLNLSAGLVPYAREKIDAALKANPDCLSALTSKAYIYLIEDDFKRCSEILKKAEKINPNSIDVNCIYASMYEIKEEDKKRDEYVKRVIKINPSCVDIYNTLSITAEQKYRFKDAVKWAEKAIEVDPDHWRGYYLAGNGLLRLGEEKKGYKLLSQSFSKNPFNVLAFNTLSILDNDFKRKEFELYETAHFAVKISKEDAPYIWPYLEPVLEEAYTRFTSQIKQTPVGPEEHNKKVLLHILPDHMSFSARTIGLPGISAEGVCFGQVILMPSPRYASLGKARGMDWKSVFEHEFLHILTLQKSDFKTSRWLTEGISTLEESDLHGDWVQFFVLAGKSNNLLPLEKLESGFLNPTYPLQVPVSYYQGAMTCRYFKEKYGKDSIIKMLEMYKKGEKTKAIVTQVSGISLEDLNKDLEKYYSKEWEKGEKFIKEFAEEIKQAKAELKIEEDNKKKYQVRRDWEPLINYWRENGQKEKAIKLLQKSLSFDDSDFLVFKVMGEIYYEQKKWKEAADILLLASYRNPFDKKVHEMAAECYKQLKDTKSQKREESILDYINKQ